MRGEFGHIFRRGGLLALALVLLPLSGVAQTPGPILFPANKATNVNPDTHLVLTFPTPPARGASGKIRIYDGNKLVDTLDLAIPSSPNPTGRVPPPPKGETRAADASPKVSDVTVKAAAYQTDYIQGVDFRFFPIIVHGNTATIFPHHNVLKYGRTYSVKIEPSVLVTAAGGLNGFKSNSAWTFTTKAAAPPAGTPRVVVAADGSGDFNTVQGALDYAPAASPRRTTIFIKKGTYEELVFVQNKANITIRGEDREQVIVTYPNNSAFNPPQASGPSRRPAFSLYNVTGFQLSTFTITNSFIGQAEALLINGQRNIVDRMTLNGSGDALTMRGSVYLTDSRIIGDGDTCLCYGPAFFNRVEMRSIGPFTWTRNDATTHGNVFLNSVFIAVDKPLPWTVNADGTGGQKVKAVLARLPNNNGGNFPYAEMVLINARTDGVPDEGWGPIEPGLYNVRFWEFNTRTLAGEPIDMTKRHPYARRLTMGQDANAIMDYSKPEYVLGGWRPYVE